jgi:hypothetical protein
LRAALIAVSTASAPVFIGRARSIPVRRQRTLEKAAEARGVKGAAGHGKRLRLLGQGVDQGRVGVAEAHGRVRRHHVEITPAGGVVQPDIQAALEHDLQRIVVAGAMAALEFDRRVRLPGEGLGPGGGGHGGSCVTAAPLYLGKHEMCLLNHAL